MEKIASKANGKHTEQVRKAQTRIGWFAHKIGDPLVTARSC